MKSTRLSPGLVLILILLVTLPAIAATYRTIDAENASVSGGTLYDNGYSYPMVYNSNGGWPTISSAYSHTGTYSIRPKAFPDTDNSHERSEVYVSEGIGITYARYVRFWLYVPTNFPNYSTGRELFMQVHQGGPHYPPLALYFKPGSNLQYEVVIKKDGEQATSSASSLKYTDTLPKGQWVKFIIGWKASPTSSTGWVDVYRDGSLKYSYDGQWGYSTAVTSTQVFNLRFGLYGSPNETGAIQYIYFDNLRYGDAYSSVE